jgi:large subunit ribosomal protein LX
MWDTVLVNWKMVEVKIFRVKGEIRSPNYKTPFVKDVRALKPENAIEKVFMMLGGQHGIQRVHIKIDSTEEITVAETEDPVIRVLSKE